MKLGLSVREAAWLLGRSEPQVRRLLQAGVLAVAVAPARISPESLDALFPRDEYLGLREAALEAILTGHLEAPRPETRYARPAPITDLPRLLAASRGAKRTPRSQDASPAFDSVTIVSTSPL
jgi:hypothetical protein